MTAVFPICPNCPNGTDGKPFLYSPSVPHPFRGWDEWETADHLEGGKKGGTLERALRWAMGAALAWRRRGGCADGVTPKRVRLGASPTGALSFRQPKNRRVLPGLS